VSEIHALGLHGRLQVRFAKAIQAKGRGATSRMRYKLRQGQKRNQSWYSMLWQSASSEASACDGRHATVSS
jgi:hypothetical protein